MFKWLRNLNPFRTKYIIEKQGNDFYVCRNNFFMYERVYSTSSLDDAKDAIKRDKENRVSTIVYTEEV